MEEISQKVESRRKKKWAIETKGNKIKRIRGPISIKKKCRGGKRENKTRNVKIITFLGI